jgi:hypothetical protein
MHFYTSITCNYLPKARVLARSVKRHAPGAVFHLLLSDDPPEGWNLADEPFDTVLGIEDLQIPNIDAWVFKHELVEMCTAVKGPGALEIVRRHQPEKLIYFDPDIAVLSSLECLGRELDKHSVLLTPHLTAPESTARGVLDNEISALKHGIYNLGFLAFRCSGEGLRCMQWWSDRLLEHCRDDIPGGLFTDQRWADHIPGLFEGVRILREPVYNVATWNLSNRSITGSCPDGLLSNGQPLVFYHFSGLDSGAQEAMLGLYGQASPVLRELRSWYLQACEDEGQSILGKLPCRYNRYHNGQKIMSAHRRLYRERSDLQQAFPSPFETGDINRSYYHWYKANVEGESCADAPEPNDDELIRIHLRRTQDELHAIHRSRSWKWAQRFSRWYRMMR